MPDIIAAVQGALLAARKAQDKDRTLLLGTVLSVLKNRELEVGALTEPDALDVLRKQVKQRRESVEAFQKGGRADLADGETRQIRIIEEFLPPDVDPGEIRAAVRAAMDGGARDVGKLMGQVMPAFKGRADGKLINQIVREELARG
jgi:uncharacterized protein YqeY